MSWSSLVHIAPHLDWVVPRFYVTGVFRYVRLQFLVGYRSLFFVRVPWDWDVHRLPFLLVCMSSSTYRVYYINTGPALPQVSSWLFDVKWSEAKTLRHRALTSILVLLCWITAVVSSTHVQTCVLLEHLDQSLLDATHRFHADPH